MYTGAAGFATGVESLDGGAAAVVGPDAATCVVCCRNDGNHFAGHVDPEAEAGFVDVGEVLFCFVGVNMGDVEKDAFVSCFFHFGVDGPGNNVPGGEVFAFVVFVHEALAVFEPENAAKTSDCFGDEEGVCFGVEKGGRVKLDEFHVGDLCSGPVAHGNTVSGCYVGVGGVGIDVAEPAGCQHGDTGEDGFWFSLQGVEHVGAVTGDVVGFDAEMVLGQQFNGVVVFE